MDLTDAEDVDILRHREAHFGGDFGVMRDYYHAHGKGALFDPQRIERLAQIEQQLGKNLAEELLSEEDQEYLGGIQELYKRLREIFEVKNPKRENPQLIADLILADGNEEEAIAACVAAGESIVPDLVKLVRMTEYSDPLYPGYGTARDLAAQALGRIGHPEAIVPLYECVGSDDHRLEESALEALVHLPCKSFLLQRLRSRPLSPDTERSAVVLASLDPDEEIAAACLEQLQDPAILSTLPLSAYLVLCCSEQKPELKRLAERSECPDPTREEIRFLVQSPSEGATPDPQQQSQTGDSPADL